MTTREQLVERVACALWAVDGHGAKEIFMRQNKCGGDTKETQTILVNCFRRAHAAVAECEKSMAVTYTIQVPEELAKLQAQCAVMRAALESECSCVPIHGAHHESCVVHIHKSALSPDAGQKVLAVVQAAQRVSDTKFAVDLEAAVADLDKALSALGWKP